MLSATICEGGILLLWELFGSIGMRLVWQLLEVWSLLRPNIFPIRGGGGWGARPFLAIPLQSTFHHHRSQGMQLHKLPLTKYVPPASQPGVINQKFRPLYGVLPWFFWNKNWSVILLGGFCRSNWIYSSPSQCFPNKSGQLLDIERYLDRFVIETGQLWYFAVWALLKRGWGVVKIFVFGKLSRSSNFCD